MRKSKFTEEQILGILSQVNAGKRIEEVCREYKISNYTFYKWKKKFTGMSTTDAKRLRELEAENSKLKRVIADQSLDIIVLKDALGKK